MHKQNQQAEYLHWRGHLIAKNVPVSFTLDKYIKFLKYVNRLLCNLLCVSPSLWASELAQCKLIPADWLEWYLVLICRYGGVCLCLQNFAILETFFRFLVAAHLTDPEKNSHYECVWLYRQKWTRHYTQAA